MKKALLLCASHNDLGLIKALRKLGYYIIVTGNIPGLVGEKFCDLYIQADYSDKEKILKIAQKHEIDAVCQCCNDFGVYSASYVAEKLGLPGYDSFETTLILHNKDKFKKMALELGIRTPYTRSFTDFDDSVQYIKDNPKFPMIIKPTDASAGIGISRVDSQDEAFQAIKIAFDKSRAKTIVIEPFIHGSQHGFCTFLRNKKVVAITSNNEYSILNPYRVEIDTYPATNFDSVRKELCEQIELIARTLNLVDGIFHLQYIYDGKYAWIIEVMRRVLGNMYHVPGNNLTNMDWEYWETRARCGLDCSGMIEFPEQEGFYAYKTILGDKNGSVSGVQIPEKYDKYLTNKFYIKSINSEIKNYKSEPYGFLFLNFSSQDEMIDCLVTNYSNNILQIS